MNRTAQMIAAVRLAFFFGVGPSAAAEVKSDSVTGLAAPVTRHRNVALRPRGSEIPRWEFTALLVLVRQAASSAGTGRPATTGGSSLGMTRTESDNQVSSQVTLPFKVLSTRRMTSSMLL